MKKTMLSQAIWMAPLALGLLAMPVFALAEKGAQHHGGHSSAMMDSSSATMVGVQHPCSSQTQGASPAADKSAANRSAVAQRPALDQDVGALQPGSGLP